MNKKVRVPKLNKKKVYQFRFFSASDQKMVTSKRPATSAFIENKHFEKVVDSGKFVDITMLDEDGLLIDEYLPVYEYDVKIGDVTKVNSNQKEHYKPSELDILRVLKNSPTLAALVKRYQGTSNNEGRIIDLLKALEANELITGSIKTSFKLTKKGEATLREIHREDGCFDMRVFGSEKWQRVEVWEFMDDDGKKYSSFELFVLNRVHAGARNFSTIRLGINPLVTDDEIKEALNRLLSRGIISKLNGNSDEAYKLSSSGESLLRKCFSYGKSLANNIFYPSPELTI